MATVDRWLLPDGIEEVLPPQARRLKHPPTGAGYVPGLGL